MRISPEDVRNTAILARLHLTDAEATKVQYDLSQIFTYIDQIQEVDVTGVEPTTHAVPLACPWRLDERGEHLSTDMALQQAPKKEAAFFAVPAILSKEE